MTSPLDLVPKHDGDFSGSSILYISNNFQNTNVCFKLNKKYYNEGKLFLAFGPTTNSHHVKPCLAKDFTGCYVVALLKIIISFSLL